MVEEMQQRLMWATDQVEGLAPELLVGAPRRVDIAAADISKLHTSQAFLHHQVLNLRG
jgi:hypothetical protein